MEAQGLDSPTAILKVAERLAIVDSHRLDHHLPHLKDPLPPFPAPFDYHNHIGAGSIKSPKYIAILTSTLYFLQ